jgi:hypothetical protein
VARRVRGAERRRWQRLPLAIPFFVRGADAQGKEFLEYAAALNISAGGALLACRRDLPRGIRISMEVPSAPSASSAALPYAIRTVKARIVRVGHLGGLSLWGLRFGRSLTKSQGTNSLSK